MLAYSIVWSVIMTAKIISMFNHKGGVAKTTNAYNIAWALTELGKKVMLVDADSQCNLTNLILNDTFDDYYENDETKFNNIKDGVKNAFTGNPEPIRPIVCPHHPYNESLFLLPGHMDLSSYDPQLNLSLTTSSTLTVLQNLPGAFYKLIELCVAEYAIDYVIIDLNPSLSSINQVLFMLSDGFIVPTNPDPFSLMALSTLRTILPRWKKDANSLNKQTEEASYPFPAKSMFFIGEIISKFSVRNQKPAAYYVDRIAQIKDNVNLNLVPVLRNASMILDSDTRDNFCLAEIKDFGGLQQSAMNYKKPIIALTDEELRTGFANIAERNNRARFREDFGNIAQFIDNFGF